MLPGLLPALAALAPLVPLAPTSEDDALARALAAVDPGAVCADVAFLADDAMAGRDTPSEELQVAARYLRARLQRLGFEPGGEDGSYLDPYVLLRRRVDLEEARLDWAHGDEHLELRFGDDYVVPPGSIADRVVAGSVVFVGDGTAAELEGLELEGLWALARYDDDAWRDARDRAHAAGAAGIALVAEAEDRGFRRRFRWYGGAGRAGGLVLGDEAFPTVLVAPGPGERILEGIEGLGAVPGAVLVETSAVADGAEEHVVENVAGLWPGSDPELRREVVVLSAHYDHVGVQGGEIHNGADDNASGTSALLAVAEALAAHGPLARSVLVLWVSGEEKGLLGSKAWARSPTLPDGHRVVADVNVDMVGRNDPSKLLLTPTSAHPAYNGLSRLVERLAPEEGFDELGSCDAYWQRSDHHSFHQELGVPVCFLFADVHEDYHRPGDDPEKIDCDKVARVARLVVRMLVELQGDDLAPAAGR